jgi:hypothetical protein
VGDEPIPAGGQVHGERTGLVDDAVVEGDVGDEAELRVAGVEQIDEGTGRRVRRPNWMFRKGAMPLPPTRKVSPLKVSNVGTPNCWLPSKPEK